VTISPGYSQAHSKGASSGQPNILFFAFDDLNDGINPLGYRQAITPNLDRLAEAGIMFTNARAPGVYCAPSRAEGSVKLFDMMGRKIFQNDYHESGWYVVNTSGFHPGMYLLTMEGYGSPQMVSQKVIIN